MHRKPQQSHALFTILSTLMMGLLVGCGADPEPVTDTVPADPTDTVPADPTDIMPADPTNPATASGTNDGGATPKTDEAPDTAKDTPVATTPVAVEMTDVAGYQAVIEKHKGKVIVVDFWATWCEPCVERFPHIVELSHQFPADKVAFISVSLDDPEDKEKVEEFLTKEQAGKMTNLHSTLDVADAFEAFDIADGIPNYKLYDINGEVKYRFALSENDKQDVLAAEELDIKLREMLK